MTMTRKAGAGDLARRITHRREALGLSVEDLAEETGIDPGFLAYFEQSADVRLPPPTLRSIARALKTSPTGLLGGDQEAASGHGEARLGAILEPMTPAECRRHLESGGIGRVVYRAARGPLAVPVNFRFSKNEVMFSTTVDLAIQLESQGIVGFEIDRIDEALSEGWSVVVTGMARRVDLPEELVEHAAHSVTPWAGGARTAVVAIAASEVTGRSIIHDIA